MGQIAEVLKSNVSITLYVGCLCLIGFVSLFSERIKNAVRWLFCTRRTRRQAIVSLCAAATAFILFDRRETIGWKRMAYIDVSIGVFVVLLWLFTFVQSPLFAVYRKKYTDFVRKGFAIERFSVVQKKPWFVRTTKDNIGYALLFERYCLEVKRAADACVVLKDCLKRALLPFEKEKISAVLARTYFELGSYRTARELIEQLKNPSVAELSVLGCIYEEAGEKDRADDIWLRLKDDVEKNNYEQSEIGVFYNNYGRNSFLNGNYVEALTFFKKATETAKKLHYADVLHCSYSNVVMCLLRSGNEREAERYYNEYLQLFDGKAIGKQEQIELLNFKLADAKQTKNLRLVKKTIESLYEKKDECDVKDKLNLWISALRISADLEMDVSRILADLTEWEEELFSLEPKLRFVFCKDIWIVFQKIRLYPGSKFEPLQRGVVRYMTTQAEDDLREMKNALPVYAVLSQGECVKDEIYLKSGVTKTWDYQIAKKKFLELAELYEKNGLKFSAFNVLLDAIDAVYVPENLVGISADGIAVTKYDAEVRQLFYAAYDKSKSFAAHPGMAVARIKLSAFAFHFGEEKIAAETYEQFRNTNISKLLLNDRLRGQIEWIENRLEAKK